MLIFNCYESNAFKISTRQIFPKTLMVCPSFSCLMVSITLLSWEWIGVHFASVSYPFPLPSFVDSGYSHGDCPLVKFLVRGSLWPKDSQNLTQTVRMEDIQLVGDDITDLPCFCPIKYWSYNFAFGDL